MAETGHRPLGVAARIAGKQTSASGLLFGQYRGSAAIARDRSPVR
jgi:hypothetical protein